MQLFIHKRKLIFLIVPKAFFHNKVVILQFEVDGVVSGTGNNAQYQIVEEGFRQGPETAQILLLLTGELNVWD
jgi:hypothetical protein